MLLDSLILLILPYSLFSLSDLYSQYSPFSRRMLGIRCSRPRSEAERAQVSRPQAGTSEASAQEEEDNAGIFQIDFRFGLSDFPDLSLTFSRTGTKAFPFVHVWFKVVEQCSL